jgi:PAS domain S-box-containing protein
MLPGTRRPLLTLNSTLLLALLAVVAITLLFLPPWAGAVRLAAFLLSVFLVIVLAFRDRAERTKLELDILRLTAILNASEDAIIGKTLDGTILTWNRGAQLLFGYAADEVIGKSVQILYPSDRLDEFEQILERLQRGESADPFDTIRVAKDGRRIDVSISESLMRDAQGRAIGVSKIVRDATERKRAEAATRFLAEVNDVLASSLDYETTLASVARLAVPHLADWCAVHILTDDGTIHQLALSHVDPAKVTFAQELQRRYLEDPSVPYSVSNVIRTGKPELAPPFAAEPIAPVHDAGAVTLPPHLPLESLMVVPLIAPGEILGAITFVSAESGRRYGPADLALAQDLAHRAALAVDNARLYHRAQSLNEELDQRVAQRTRELANSKQNLETEIAEHQRANEQLRLLAAHLQSAREEERIGIAREIHDEIGTLMTAIKMDLAFLEREIVGNGSQKSPEALSAEIGGTT